MLTLGLMTGTAIDGAIDLAVIETDGKRILSFGPWALRPYGAELGPVLWAATEDALKWDFEGPEPESFRVAEKKMTEAHAKVIKAFIKEVGLSPADISLVGFHGQTVLHRPPTRGGRGFTRQLGDGSLLATLIGIDVVNDFRSADMDAGGQGAPLSPIYHVALMRHFDMEPPCAALNLGGLANVTCWNGGDDFVAFDTGPANGPINDWVKRHTGREFDENGELAARGTVNDQLLASMLQHPYLKLGVPKSLDRFDFSADLAAGLSLEDGAATLTALTAKTIAGGLELLRVMPRQIILCGGGRRNPELVRAIRLATPVAVKLAEDVSWRGDAVEAETFAYLAARTAKQLPISFPTTTGVRQPCVGGRLWTVRS